MEELNGVGPTFFTYVLDGPVDWFRGAVHLDDLLEQCREDREEFRNVSKLLMGAVAAVLKECCEWEGSITAGPYVFALPVHDSSSLHLGFVWKQNNNGTTFIASPLPLWWLDEPSYSQTGKKGHGA